MSDELTQDKQAQDAQAIRERAYALWQQAGSPAGRETEFWHQAEAEAAPSEAALDEDIEDSFPASDPTNRS